MIYRKLITAMREMQIGYHRSSEKDRLPAVERDPEKLGAESWP